MREPGSLSCWLTAPNLCDLLDAASSAEPYETGGVLMGWRDVAGNYVVSDIIGPGPGASHRPTRFDPDVPWQLAEIAHLYEASGRRVTYLGDWHSHPDGTAVPSLLDRQTMLSVSRAPEARAPRPLMAILGSTPQWHIRVWTLSRWRWLGLRTPQAEEVAVLAWSGTEDPTGFDDAAS